MTEEFDFEEDIYEEKISEFFNDYEDYLNNKLIPEALAYYLNKAFELEVLSKCPIKSHLNSALDVFNLECDIDKTILRVEEILLVKYKIKIIDYDTSRLEKLK